MDTILVAPLIHMLQTWPPEVLSLISLGVCVVSLLVVFRFFGVNGLYLYNIVALLCSNIQVLKSVQFRFCSEPIALGTLVFSTTYLASSLLTEHYGARVAKTGVNLSIVAQVLMTLWMIIAVGYPPLSGTQKDPVWETWRQMEWAMSVLFTPSLRVLLASLVSFWVSQQCSIYLFQMLHTPRSDSWIRLSLKTGLSSLGAAVLDTVLFSVLAWQVLADTPVNGATLWITYIFSTLVARGIISILTAPLLSFSYYCQPTRSF
jgi:queuosine precursor transporter